jgi:pyruvate ferredoxin oxidoreductase beta subunit
MGKTEKKKDLPEIAAAHGIPYVATASVAYLRDLKRKVKKAMSFHGARYIQIDTPCPSVWSFPSHLTLEIGRLGVNCGLVPLFEIENNRVGNVRKLKNKLPVADYLKGQKRYRHLFDDPAGCAQLQNLQEIADHNIEKYGLMTPA